MRTIKETRENGHWIIHEKSLSPPPDDPISEDDESVAPDTSLDNGDKGVYPLSESADPTIPWVGKTSLKRSDKGERSNGIVIYKFLPPTPNRESEISDLELIERAKKGKNEAFGTIYERHVNRIYSYLYYRTGSHPDTEELTQTVFLNAFVNCGNFVPKGEGLVSSWLFRIAHNLMANFHRDSSRHRNHQYGGDKPKDEVLMDFASHFGNPESEVELDERVVMVRKAVSRLLPTQAQVIYFRFVEELSNGEIGRILGKSEGAIKALQHRALAALRNDQELLKLFFSSNNS
ncbi:sigma-70 family RNA polymerase sigma factor [Candidatus Microgenomates bacterium]|nr:sigma-70 family RNA polymerase sigma factor [Candidatus Microgenomates bacterium]